MSSFTAACVQMTSKGNVQENLYLATALIREAASAGADFIATPEVTNMLEPHKSEARAKAQFQENDITLKAFRALAEETGKWILAGSLVIKNPDDDRLANRSFLIRPDGDIAAQYDKIHMFDVELDTGESHKESRAYAPGDAAQLAETTWGMFGMSVCYDVRFPHLYQKLALAGAGVLTVPAAFTATTGEAHWHILLRARAIENGAFVIAPAQCGQHTEKRHTYGHSLIIDPWGKILAEAGEEPGFVTAEINMAEVTRRRQQIPNLRNIRDFSMHAPDSVADAAE
ncbi:carbon-nitrogen hydrolase family protein [Sneathiella sp. HT1-7]|uniref:carbon-nitrogen hydrolase family protein n=1 Tax=Sneathiella sp. HT1-7 TaxID=2887192 RepID=UPI001D14FE3B|nr:carbon-nitrogen hydrolase family protein [Sneathiella sp. HT1-7]MCC3303200.1 carbon-nitrogen hydrolase family protein [Sneathiella sp. HT1-7]